MISRIRKWLRARRIRTISREIEWTRAAADAHIQGLESELLDLCSAQIRESTSRPARIERDTVVFGITAALVLPLILADVATKFG